MLGIHSGGLTPTRGDDNVAGATQHQAAVGPLTGRAAWRRPPRAKTAFTDGTLLRELVARLERARASLESARHTSNEAGTAAKPKRWCGASPLASKRAAWRERRNAARHSTAF